MSCEFAKIFVGNVVVELLLCFELSTIEFSPKAAPFDIENIALTCNNLQNHDKLVLCVGYR